MRLLTFFDIIQVTTHFRLRLVFGFSPFLFDGIDAAVVVVVVVVVIGGWEFVIVRNDSFLFDIVRFIVLRCVVGGCVIIIGKGRRRYQTRRRPPYHRHHCQMRFHSVWTVYRVIV